MSLSCATDPDADSQAIDRVEVHPASHALHIPTSRTVELSATARTRSGVVLSNRSVSWSSSATDVASVSSSGFVTAVSIGTATITASIDGITGSSSITVAPSPVASVALTVDRSLLVVGATATATVVLRDGNGAIVTSPQVTFASSHPNVASVTSTGAITALGAGAAVISATSSSQTGNALVCVTQTAPNLRLNYVTLSQSTQTLSGNIPMISGGLPAEVRVHASNSDDLILGCTLPRFRMIAYEGATEVLRAEVDALGPLPRSSDPYTPIARFIIPSQWISPSLRVLVEVDPSNGWTEADETDNAWPSSGTPAQINVTTVSPLCVRFVPIFLESGGSAGVVDSAAIEVYTDGLRKMYPIAQVDADVGALLSTGIPFEPRDFDLWLSVLAELNLRRLVEGSNRYYSGVIRLPATLTNSQLHGVGYIPNELGPLDGPTRTSMFVGTGWHLTNTNLGNLVAHELGHNHRRFHPPCETFPGQDPGYPYPQGLIGVPGTDMYTYSRTGVGPFTFPQGFRYDYQASCPSNAKWVSDYTYQAMLAARRAADSLTTVAARVHREECDCIVIWGSVAGDSITLNPAFVTRTFAQVPTGGGSFFVEGVREDGRVAFSVAVEPTAIDHIPRVRHFAFTLPISQADRESLALLRASGYGRPATLVRQAARAGRGALLAAGSEVSLRLRSTGRAELTLPENVRAALVRSATTGEVLAISRGSVVTIDGRHPDVDVTLSDGVRSQTFRVRRQ